MTMMRRFKLWLYHLTRNHCKQTATEFTQQLLANFSCIDRPMARCCDPFGLAVIVRPATGGHVASFDDEIV